MIWENRSTGPSFRMIARKTAGSTSPSRLGFRVAIGLAAAVLAVVAVTQFRALRGTQDSTAKRLRSAGSAARNPEVLTDIGRETDRGFVALRAARLLLAEELDRSWMDELPDDERRQAEAGARQRLERAGAAAREVLASRPASWQAHMVAGASQYLLASRYGSRNPWSSRAAWEPPLRAAIGIAPAQPEPRRLLAALLLNEWSLATPAQRAEAVALLAKAFEDRTTFKLYLPVWLRLAATFDQLVEVIPNRPANWNDLEQLLASKGDWERYARVRSLRDLSSLAAAETLIELGIEQRRFGDRSGAQRSILAAVDLLPVRLDAFPLLERAARELPSAPERPAAQRRFSRWFDWIWEQCSLAACPAAETAATLARLGSRTSAAEQALCHLIGGDEAAAAELEARSLRSGDPAWTRYLLLKARLALTDDDAETAATALDRVPRAWRHRGAWFAAARGKARADGIAVADRGDSGWIEEEVLRREFLRGEASRVELRFPPETVPGVIEIDLNGGLAQYRVVGPGTVLRVPLPAAELCYLDLRWLTSRSGPPPRFELA